MLLILRTVRAVAAATLALGLTAASPKPVHAADMLPPCPDSPNCVSSLAEQPARRIAPIAFSGPAEAAQQRLLRLIEATPGASVVEARPGRIVAQYRSRVFGFVDDLQLELDVAAGVFQVRSASRTGYWDLGVNRRRVEALREQFERGR